MTDQWVLSTTILESLRETTLFYPCSGADLKMPLEIFAPYVTDFWFVDCNYFQHESSMTDLFSYMRPADQQPPVLADDERYVLLQTRIQGPPRWHRRHPDITPCILTETYKHRASGRQIRIHRRRGYGYSALAKEITTLGVFFYRGDSSGEGGSGNLWLQRENLERALSKLIAGGLVASDGSDGRRLNALYGPYKNFYHPGHREENKTPAAWIADSQPFVGPNGRHFNCIGYAGYRYGPTLIWQVQQTESRSPHPQQEIRPLPPGATLHELF